MCLRNCFDFLPPAARGTLFEKTAPLDPPQKLLINFLLMGPTRASAKIFYQEEHL